MKRRIYSGEDLARVILETMPSNYFATCFIIFKNKDNHKISIHMGWLSKMI
jgi:hypothetical protein